MCAQSIKRPRIRDATDEFIMLGPASQPETLRMHVVTAGQGPPLLLLHGAPQNHLAWEALIHRYAQHFRVICPDLRGAGWTDAPKDGYDPASLMSDLKALLEHYGVSKVRIVAHDWSAIVAFMLAIRQPELVEALVIISIPDLFVKPDFRVIKLLKAGWFELVLPLPIIGALATRSGRQSMLKYMFTLTGSTYSGPVPHTDLYLQLLREPARARALSRLYRATIVPTLIGLVLGRYRKMSLQVPTLQIFGDEDPAANLMNMGRHQGRSRTLHFERVPGAGHFVLDEAPNEVLLRTVSFFGQLNSLDSPAVQD